jgi:integrase
MRALLIFAAYSGMRPGELFALEWADIDFDAMRIHVSRRLYKGRVDLPKSNKPRTIALTPPARDAILGQPTRQDGQLVFRSKRGVRLSQPTLSSYWAQVLARAGLDFDFYLATKHYAVHYLYAELGLPARVIAEQMGWSLRAVEKLLTVYGHGDVGALEEIDRAFRINVAPLRAVNSAATGTQERPQSAV